MRNRDAPTGIPLSYVAGLVVWIGYEDVPLVIDHVGVQVVRAAWVICIVPGIDECRLIFVGHVYESNRNLSRIAPLSHIGIRSPRVNQLVLDNHILPVVVD